MTSTAAAPGRRGARWWPAAIVVALATVLTLVGIAVGLFFNPLWVGFEQDRTRADLWTGYPPSTVHAVTDSVVGEVFLGPGTFTQVVGGVPVFDARERAHMADVHRMVVGFALAVLIGIVALALAGIRWRRRPGSGGRSPAAPRSSPSARS